MIAYIRIPKTASCTVLDAIEGVQSVEHEPIEFYPDAVATFTFVRNPWERLYSWYRHAAYFHQRTFREYVLGEQTHPMHPVAPTQFYRHGNANQTDMLVADQRDWFRTRRPTCIGRFEHLERDLRCIGDTLGFKVGAVQHLNQTEHERPYLGADHWDDEMLERMAPLFDPFAAEFNYDAPR